jgi:surface protein
MQPINLRNGAAVTHTVAMGNLLSTDQSTLYLDANSGFDASRPITVFMVATTRLGNAVTFKEVGPSALLSNFSVTNKLVGDAPFALTDPVSNSTGAFTYTSSNLAVATVSGSTVTVVGGGTTTITATQAATASYGSNSISATFSVTVPPVLSLDSNGATIKYNGNAADVPASSALFIQADPRGTNEWFAVIKDDMKAAITGYASGTNAPFIPIGQTIPVPFNNIVTTLMTDISSTFLNSTSFNQPIGSWDTSNVVNMSQMFYAAHIFNQPIGSWNTDKLTVLDGMFINTFYFNQPIGSWNTAKVTNMRDMFMNATAFNQPIGSWNTAQVTNMGTMFINANRFNQPIDSWNTAKVTDMIQMFRDATKFNQPIGSWNTANVINMSRMFQSATAFNQPIDNWNVVKVIYLSDFRIDSALSTENTPLKFR